MKFSLLYPAEQALFFSFFKARRGRREAGVGVERDSGRHTCLALQACFVLALKTRQNSVCSPGYRYCHHLSYPRRKKERSWEQEQKVELTKNLTCDQALFFFGERDSAKVSERGKGKKRTPSFSPRLQSKKARRTA